MRINGIQGRDSFFSITAPFAHLSLRESLRRPSPVAALLLFAAFLIASMLLTGCMTPPKIQGVMLPFMAVKKTVINQMPMGSVKHESLNGRELTSYYFNPKDFDEDATDRAERAYAKVTILGAGRPYGIDVKVMREKRTRGKYTLVGEDRKLTKELIDRIREALADRRDDRNIIDDFRAF